MLEDYANRMRYRLPSFIVLIFLAIMPSDGFGFSTCLCHHLFGFFCPACGLTRSMSSLLNLELSKSLSYHPLGLIILSYICLCFFTNEPNFLKSKIGIRNKTCQTVFSFKSLIFLFFMAWFLRLFKF